VNAYTDANLFETMRRDESDGAGPHELVHLIRGEAKPGEQALGSCIRRKLPTSCDPTVDAYTYANLFEIGFVARLIFYTLERQGLHWWTSLSLSLSARWFGSSGYC
jgi:hypothetical protein